MELNPTFKAAWMNSTLRAWSIATRPWSFTASIVPVALVGASLYNTGYVQANDINLLSLVRIYALNAFFV